MIELSDVSYWYEPGKEVLRNISANIAGGRIYGLLGLNGTGKTTLLKLLSGLLFPKQGRITIDGENIVLRNVSTLMKVVFMPAELDFRDETAGKYVSMNSVFYPSFSREVLEDSLDKFGIGSPELSLKELSLGQKHKFMFAFLLSLGTEFLFLDEPLNGMDIPSRNTFRKLLFRHLREDQTAIISTHVTADLSNIITDVLIIREDGSLFCASLEDLSHRYIYGIAASDTGAVYAENCAEGYRVIRQNDGEPESEIPVDILFNAVIKGAIR